jgi:outer membrane protein
MRTTQSSRRLLLPLLAALCVGAPMALAPMADAHAEVPKVGKLAMVDMQRVLNETKAGKAARDKLEKSSKAKQAKFDKKREKLESDASKLDTLSGAQLAAAQEKLQQESMELQNMLMALEQELAKQQQQLLEEMYSNSQAIVAEIAKSKGLDLVLVRDQMTVIYAKAGLDITAEVVKSYDKKHPA